jgi:hypothetical protein
MEFKGQLDYVAVRIEMFNAGSTPAHKFRFSISCDIRPAEGYLVEDGSLKSAVEGGILMVPGASSWLNCGVKINAAERNALRADTSIVLVHGLVEYSDLFGEDRYYKFSFINQAMPSGTLHWGLQPSKFPSEAN